MDFHPAANLFPLDETNLDSLAEDIKTNGQTVPIELLDGKILDGRRRYMACEKVGIEPVYKEVAPDDPVIYVVSLNLHRRHLTKSQRAMAASKAKEYYDEQALERMKTGKAIDPRIKKAGGQVGRSRDVAGKAFDVSGSYVDIATKVRKNGGEKATTAIERGESTVSEEAAKIQKNSSNFKPRLPKMSVGVKLANEAINCLGRIPKDDKKRDRGFQIVKDWLEHNQ